MNIVLLLLFICVSPLLVFSQKTEPPDIKTVPPAPPAATPKPAPPPPPFTAEHEVKHFASLAYEYQNAYRLTPLWRNVDAATGAPNIKTKLNATAIGTPANPRSNYTVRNSFKNCKIPILLFQYRTIFLTNFK